MGGRKRKVTNREENMESFYLTRKLFCTLERTIFHHMGNNFPPFITKQRKTRILLLLENIFPHQPNTIYMLIVLFVMLLNMQLLESTLGNSHISIYVELVFKTKSLWKFLIYLCLFFLTYSSNAEEENRPCL